MTRNQWSIVRNDGQLVSPILDKESIVSWVLFDNFGKLREQYRKLLYEAYKYGDGSCCINIDSDLYKATFRRLGNRDYVAIEVSPRMPAPNDVLQQDLFSPRQWLVHQDGTISELLTCSLSVSFKSDTTFVESAKRRASC
ncbi:MAG: hypothetical protein MI746_02300 [Pseudomonadales bacterium]|nr:hypothetical protein [Pseudomonadales bacterium]